MLIEITHTIRDYNNTFEEQYPENYLMSNENKYIKIEKKSPKYM